MTDIRRRLSAFMIGFAALGLLGQAPPPPPPPPEPDDGRIIGGTPAGPGEFPWQVEIYWKEPPANGKPPWQAAHKCGGALVSPDSRATSTVWVVTAAHCLYSKSYRPRTIAREIGVRVGFVRLDQVSSGERFNIAPGGIIVHPAYIAAREYAPGPVGTRFDGRLETRREYRTGYTHDLALLKLDRPVPRSALARPIALAQSGVAIGQEVAVSGWGVSGGEGAPGAAGVSLSAETKSPAQLQFVTVQVKPCEPDQAGGPTLPTHFCAGAPGKDSCMGDSGGPVALADTPPLLVGIVSRRPFGVQTCGGRNVQTRYTRIDAEAAYWLTTMMKSR